MCQNFKGLSKEASLLTNFIYAPDSLKMLPSFRNIYIQHINQYFKIAFNLITLVINNVLVLMSILGRRVEIGVFT